MTQQQLLGTVSTLPLTLPDSRVMVAQAPLGHGRSGGALVADPKMRVPIGVEVWPGQMAVVVKITFAYDPAIADQVASIAHRQRPLTVADAATADGATPHELTAPHDFAHFKPQTDLVLVGSSYGPKALSTIGAQVAATSGKTRIERSFSTVGPSPIERMPLLGQFVRDVDGETATAPVGPAGPWTITREQRAQHQEKGDEVEMLPPSARVPETPFPYNEELMQNRLLHSWEMLNEPGWLDDSNALSFAPPMQRTPYGTYLESDFVLEMTGLSLGGERRVIRMPGFGPWMICETRVDDYLLEPKLDTVTLHTDDNQISVVWRAHVPLMSTHHQWEVNRIILTVERDRDERPLGAVYRDLQRGQFFRAPEEQDIRGTADDWIEADEDVELLLEAFDAFDLPAEPTITIEEYARLTAELAFSGEPREKILAKADLDEAMWLLEDQGWMERISAALTAGDFSLSDTYGKVYEEVWISYGSPESEPGESEPPESEA